MRSNAEVNFEISAEDMETLKNLPQIEDYGDASMMPVYGGKMNIKNMAKMAISAIKGS